MRCHRSVHPAPGTASGRGGGIRSQLRHAILVRGRAVDLCMSAAPVLFAALFFVAAAFPSPSLDAASSADVVVVADSCSCEPILSFEPYGSSTSWAPWTLSWTSGDDTQPGRCLAEGCGTARPCKGDFRVQVSWPQAPTPPCTGIASVYFMKSDKPVWYRQGQLDLAYGFVPIDDVGGAAVECKKSSELSDGYIGEPDDGMDIIQISCTKADGTVHQVHINVREACLGCETE